MKYDVSPDMLEKCIDHYISEITKLKNENRLLRELLSQRKEGEKGK